jgi:RNA polymerase sigma-70 factor (ECF subfamily)
VSSQVDSFLAALPTALREPFASARETLEPRLSTILAEARAAWPGVELDASSFLAFLAERVPAGAGPEALGRFNLTGLYIACGCQLGDARAVSAFRDRYLPVIARAVATIELPRATREDAEQTIFQKLFLGDEESRPKICHYAGEGELETWLRVVATRHAIDLARRERAGRRNLDEESQLLDLADACDDPELQLLKERYRVEFKEAFESAFATLGREQRNLLRYQVLEGLSIDEIGLLYQVHRATAARRLARVREDLLERTRETLLARLKLQPGASEFESILRLIQSELQVSITRLLQPEPTVAKK